MFQLFHIIFEHGNFLGEYININMLDLRQKSIQLNATCRSTYSSFQFSCSLVDFEICP